MTRRNVTVDINYTSLITLLYINSTHLIIISFHIEIIKLLRLLINISKLRITKLIIHSIIHML